MYIYKYFLLFNIIIFFQGLNRTFDTIHKLDEHIDVGNQNTWTYFKGDNGNNDNDALWYSVSTPKAVR